MKNKIVLLIFLISISLTYSQQFDSENNEFINFNTHKVNLQIDGNNYTGEFKSFKSKKDKQEYLIYSYFSRTIIIQLNKPVKEIKSIASELIIEKIKLVHNKDLDSITKNINKNGFDNCTNCIIVYEDTNYNMILAKP